MARPRRTYGSMSAPARDIVQARSYCGGRGRLLWHHPHAGPGHCPVAKEAGRQRRRSQTPPDRPRRRLQADALAYRVVGLSLSKLRAACRRFPVVREVRVFGSRARQLAWSPPSRPGTRSLSPACCWRVVPYAFHTNSIQVPYKFHTGCLSPAPSAFRPPLPMPTLHGAASMRKAKGRRLEGKSRLAPNL